MNVKLVRQTLRLVFFLCLFISLLTFLPGSLAAQGATHTVTTTADSGPGSLRQAIADSVGGDVINFDASLAGQTIHLQSTLFIDKNLTIDGTDRDITISGDSDADGVGDVRIMQVNAGIKIILKFLTLEKGFADEGNGGGILGSCAGYSCGSVEIYDSTVNDNFAAGSGGGVYANPIYVYRSTFAGNEAGDRGGALVGTGIRAENSTFFSNKARCTGGIANIVINSDEELAAIGVRNSTFSHNISTDACGIAIDSDAAFGEDSKVFNTIVANGIGPGWEASGCPEPGAYWRGNIIEDGVCRADYSGDPLLGPLQDNGGPTATMALQPGSKAIDAVVDASYLGYPPLDTDQRGIARPQDGLGDGIARSDIGAIEVEAGAYPNLVQNGFLNEDFLHWQKNPTHTWVIIRSAEGDKYMTAWPWNGYTIFQEGLSVESGKDYRACVDHFSDTTYSYAVNLQLLSPTGTNLGLNRPLVRGDQCFDFQATASTTNGRIILLFSQLKTPGTQLAIDDIRLYLLGAEPPAGKGTIIITKSANPAVDTLFNFSGDLGRFTLQDPTNPSRTFADLVPRPYIIREDALSACWTFSGVSCEPAAAAAISGREVTIDLAAGTTVTCTYVNTCTPDSGEELVRNGGFDERLAYWQWSPSHTWVSIKKDGSDLYVKAWPWNGYSLFQDGLSLTPGPYEACLDVVEKTDPNSAISIYVFGSGLWNDLIHHGALAAGTGRKCLGFEVPEAAANARFALVFGGLTTPGTSFSFDDVSLRALGGPPPPEKGTITITKNASPADNTPFTFSGDLGSFTLQDPAVKSKTVTDLDPGQYVIREDALPASWSFSGISCDPAAAAAISGREVTINLDSGAAVTCTYSNTYTTGGGEEILLNGGFDERLVNWNWNPSHTWVSVKKDGTNVYVKVWPWNGYAFFQQGFALVGGQTYEACLDILEKTDDKTSISLEILAPNTTQVTLNQQLSGGIGRKCVSFTAPESASNAVFNVRFWGLTSPGTSFSFDDVSLKEQ